MNQSTRRKARHLLHFLITLVVIGCQIALPLGATLAAIQPPPAVAQAAIHELGLGDWLAQHAGDLAAWAQPLWGQPKRAVAQTAAPGGVTANLAAWYKADGTVSTTQWNDESGNGKHMLAAGTGTAASMPTLDATPGATNNFNPRVAFLSNADGNRKWTMTASGNNVFATTSTPGTIFNVSSFPDETVYDVPQMYAFEDDDPGLNLVTDRNSANDIRVIFQRDNGGTGSAGWDFAVPGVSQTQPLLTAHAWNYAAGGNTFTFNGYDYTPSSNPFIGATSPRYIFGAELTNGAGEAHSGYTSENIVYSVEWPANSSERKRINSYLAIKYGITLLGSGTLAGGTADATFGGTADYLDSASTVIWSGTTSNSSYHNNVAGIGRDDASALNQKQATSTNAGFQPTIGLGTIAASNAANSNTFGADKSFLLWGNNNQPASYGVSYTPSSFTPIAGYFRMNRVWKVQETGTVGTVVVQAVGADHLLVSSDVTFASGVTEIAMSNGSATVDFTNGQFFTFGTNATAPGGVGTGLETWVKADAGISASDGSAVATWTDQSLGGYDFTQATAGSQPTYYSTTADKLLNFNPVVDFDGSGDYLRNTTVLMPSSSPYTFLAVGIDEDTGTGYRNLFSSEAIVDYFALYKQGGATNDNGWIPYAIGGQSHSAPFIGDRGSMGKGTKYSAAGSANGYWNGTNFTSDSRTQYAQPQIVGFNSLNSATSDPFYTWTDGYKEDPNWSPIVDGLTFRNQFFTQSSIGADVNVELWKGRIPEFMAYSQSLSDSDIAKINSYLAIKYGITLGQGNGHVGKNGNNYNYVATDGTAIWSAATNSAYPYNITGIGRDDAEDLNQKQSKSIQAGFQPVISLGAIAATNAANTNSFAANKSYLVWGDNGQAATFGVSYSPTSFTPAAGYYRMSRIWKVQETGTVGNVVVQGSSADHLLVSSDPTFASGVTEIAFSNGSVTVDFSSGQYFTFGKEITAPGGVAAGLGLWLQANHGTSTTTDGADVSTWADNSLAGNDVSQAVVSRQPNYVANAVNFNPALDFAGAQVLSALNSGNKTLPNQTDPVTMLAVSTNRTGGDWRTLITFSGPTDHPFLGWYYNKPNLYLDSTGSVHNLFSTDVDATTIPIIMQARTNNANPQSSRLGYNGLANQQTFTSAIGQFPASDGNNNLTIGAETDSLVYPLNGLYPESIVYNRVLSDTEMRQVNTYLAIKYGIHLSDSYLASDGSTVLWDATTNAAYHHDVAGIGRDDRSGLLQKQSKSVNSNAVVTIYNGNQTGGLPVFNSANTSGFSANGSFLIWGHNGQAASFGASYSPTTFTPAAGYFRMNRIWKVQETGTITNVTVQAAGADHLLVSSDPTFATGVTEIAMTGGSATVNFTNGQYFTFGAEATAPGGVAGNLTAWYKADLGAETSGSAATDNDSVDAWRDQSLSDNDAFQSNSSIRPEWLENNGKFNFNPSVTFVPDARLQAQLSTTSWNNNDGSVYVIYNQQTAKTGWRNLVDFGLTAADSNNPQLGMSDNDRIATWMDGFDRDNTTFQPLINETRLVGYYWQFNVGGHAYTYDGQGFAGATTHKIGTTGIDIGNFANIGGDPQLAEYFPGQIAEIAMYKEKHDAATQAKVQSYFALKYGITLDANPTNATTNFDYVDSAGTTIWAGNGANSGYHNDVAGIGRDDAAALTQKQSRSVNSDDLVTISLGTPTATNAANTNSFAANKSFLIWGNNNGAASYAVNYTPTSFTPAGGYYRMSRIWKVQETGTIANVVVQATGAEHLLVSSDPTFATGVTEIAMTGGQATVNFANGQYFTFGKTQLAPGGVATDLAFWYKPDAGVTLNSDKVSAWVDQANGIELTPAAANNGPTYYDAGPDMINFNPALNFTNATRQDALRTATGLPAIPNGVSTFSVLLPDDASNRWFLHWGVIGTGYYNNYGSCSANNPGVYVNSHGGCVNNPTALGPITTPSFLSVRWNSTAGTNQWQLRRNGQLHSGTTSSTVLNVPADTALEIGDVNNRTAGNEYVGNISEVIGYTSRLGDTDRQKVESYLAIKYGITYMNDANTAATDYLNSAGAKVWDATTNSAYAANIAGIGRDDASALSQKQAQSVNSGFQPTIGLGPIATSNAANSSTFTANKSFLLWGDNNGALTLSAAYNGGANTRLARVWKVQETGTVGAVQVILPRSILSGAALRTLIVHHSDAAFGTVDRTIPLSSSGGNYVATVDFNNGDFFTFSSSSTLPEINVTPITIDFGTVNTGSTAPAQAVTIQNGGDVNLNLSNIALSGADAARFAISSNNCGATLSAGASCTVQLTFTPAVSGSRSALLVITNNDSDESTVNVALSGTTPSSSGGGGTTGTYNLAVTKSASVSNATVGTPFTYTITVLNKGSIAASNVVMTDQLPAGVTFGSANATGGGHCTQNSGTVTCTWASLAGGASATVTISVTP